MGNRLDVRKGFVQLVLCGLTFSSTLIIPLTNGGTGGAIVMFLVTAVCMGFVIVSMAEMASM